MNRCASCAKEVPEGSLFCPSCGAVQAPSSRTPTFTEPKEESSDARKSREGVRERIEEGAAQKARSGRDPSSGSVDQARFIPGTMLAGRYRIVGLLGRGGMGEVYRAEDLKLGQSVALKFLPEELQEDEKQLIRFLGEVKLARQVSHPNVCRVYDVNEVDGQHFLSMEYVDGEDLASLLRRIGRLPRDKAVVIARQLCAGLAAAHEQGILHRDLKPANIMIDGRGHARITDFGIASLAERIKGREVLAGTPAYMAPEQLAGKEVTVRSDIYSLGLVLYELFTGKKAFKAKTPTELVHLQQDSTPTTPSALLEGFDPIVERVIMRCLEKDPRDRPASAFAVAAALPGGDPLAAALAAGETPSPEMVAEAGGKGTLRPAIAISCLVFFLVGIVISIFLNIRFPEMQGVAGYTNLEKPPLLLSQDAREILKKLGNTDPALDSAFGFDYDWSFLRYIEENDHSPGRWNRLASARPSAIYFWYKQSPKHLLPVIGLSTKVSESDPPIEFSGMVDINIDTEGRLVYLQAVPPQVDKAAGPSPEPDWSVLFSAAALDPATLQPTEPTWVPPHFCDRRAAWEGSYPDNLRTPIRIEAGAYRGKPIYFNIIYPWTRPLYMEEYKEKPGEKISSIIFGILFVAVMAGATLLARRNLRLGKGDRKGAFRLALFIIFALTTEWLIETSHVPDLMEEIGLFVKGIAAALFVGCFVWLIFIALEPFLRRRWPDSMVSWNRLIAGRFHDPMIGRDILVGAVASMALWLLLYSETLLERWLGMPLSQPAMSSILAQSSLGGWQVIYNLLQSLYWAVVSTMGIFFILFLFRIILRKQWLAVTALVFIILLIAILNVEKGQFFPILPFYLVFWAIVLFVMIRFGLVATIACWTLWGLLPDIALKNLSAWYAGVTIAFYLLVLALVGYGFYTSLGGRPLFRPGAIPED